MTKTGLFVSALAGLLASVAVAHAQTSPSPYDMKFKLRAPPADGVPVYSDMSTGSSVKTRLAPATSGIVLSWCRPELAFGTWQFGNLATQRKVLDGAWCEIMAGGTRGNVEGKHLDPIR